MSPEHFWCHSFPPTDMDCWDGWRHAIPPDCPNVLLMCQYAHTHCTVLRYTPTIMLGLLHQQCRPASIAEPDNRIHMVA